MYPTWVTQGLLVIVVLINSKSYCCSCCTYRTSSDVSVVAFHMHSAPPCVKTYGVLYQAACTNSSSVSFAVMDIDSSSEHCELSAELNLQRLPTYLIYKGGKEVARLARTSERKRLGEVLQQVLAEPVAVGAAV